MDYIFMEINAVWKWIGSATAVGLVTLFIWCLWDLIVEEIRWWRKNREYRKYFESEKGGK